MGNKRNENGAEAESFVRTELKKFCDKHPEVEFTANAPSTHWLLAKTPTGKTRKRRKEFRLSSPSGLQVCVEVRVSGGGSLDIPKAADEALSCFSSGNQTLVVIQSEVFAEKHGYKSSAAIEMLHAYEYAAELIGCQLRVAKMNDMFAVLEEMLKLETAIEMGGGKASHPSGG